MKTVATFKHKNTEYRIKEVETAGTILFKVFENGKPSNFFGLGADGEVTKEVRGDLLTAYGVEARDLIVEELESLIVNNR